MPFSLVVAQRDWPIDRLDACLGSFSLVPQSELSEIVVVDFGSEHPLVLPADTDARVVVVRVEAPVWSLAEATNIGVLSARNDVVAKTDADIVLDANTIPGLLAAVAAVEGNRVALNLTQVWDVPLDYAGDDGNALYDRLRAGDDLSSSLRPRWGQGGFTIFRRGTWMDLGGFESRFIGWGNEDNDFAERVRLSGRRLRWTPRDAIRLYHLPHAPSFHKPDIARGRLRNQQLAAADRSIWRRLTFPQTTASLLFTPSLRSSLRPHVSVAIATAARSGRDRMIAEAVGSFRDQLDNDFEVLVVDNGSTDEEHTALRRALSGVDFAPVRFERLAEPSIPAARNVTTQMARGRYICVADDDDISLPNRLVDHLACFEADGSVHGSHGGWIDFDEDTGQIERNAGKERTLEQLLFGTGKITAHPATLLRADVMRRMPYDESFTLGSDLDLAIRMAQMELTVAHTRSYLALRRFHAANVTYTGAGEQSAGGNRSRVRALGRLSAARRLQLQTGAKANSPLVPCRNEMSLEQIATLLPGYVGRWCLLLEGGLLGIRSGAGSEDAPPGAPEELLTALFTLAGGDFVTRANGVDMPISWRSDAVKSLAAALELKRKAEDATGMPISIVATEQLARDREEPFPWSKMDPQTPALFLRSQRFVELADALYACRSLTEGSLLASALTVISDHDAAGDCYYLLSHPLQSRAEADGLRLSLQRRTGCIFTEIGNSGHPGNPLPPADRWH